MTAQKRQEDHERDGRTRVSHRTIAPTDPREVLVYLHRILGKVAAHDFSEKPPLTDDDDDVSRLLVGFRFIIEELEAANSERQAELERLRQLDALKTRFINLVAHELNTPITPMRLQLHLLRNAPPKGPPFHKSLGVLDRSLTRLERLVHDMLEVARLESERFPMDRREVDLGPAIEQALRDQERTVDSCGLTLDRDISTGLIAFADDMRIRQVLNNLLACAIDSTEAGGRIRVDASVRGPDVQVSVTDDGTCIPLDQVAKMFRPFTQLDERVPGRSEGTGLGLYICKGIVEAHKGRIWCESGDAGKGARFVFTVPRQRSDDASNHPNQPS